VLRIEACCAGEKLQIGVVGSALPTEAVFAISNAQSMMPAYSRLVAREVDYRANVPARVVQKALTFLADAGWPTL
jgi:hypothetical protein